MKFHWFETMNLCAGLSEEEEVWDERSGSMQSLVKLLGITKHMRRAPGPVSVSSAGHLISASETLAPTAIAVASRYGMEPLSAFDAGAWNWIRQGWEQQEFAERRRTRKEREAVIAKIHATFGPGSDKAHAAIKEKMLIWFEPPEKRARKWQGWWPRAEE